MASMTSLRADQPSAPKTSKKAALGLKCRRVAGCLFNEIQAEIQGGGGGGSGEIIDVRIKSNAE
jgi:hypothetical protein